jgi:hypothetical protein
MALNIKIAVFWDVMQYSLVDKIMTQYEVYNKMFPTDQVSDFNQPVNVIQKLRLLNLNQNIIK